MVSEKALGLRGRLARLAVRCPDCGQVWLAPGLAGGDKYACKACGTVFVKSVSGAPRPSHNLQHPLQRRQCYGENYIGAQEVTGDSSPGGDAEQRSEELPLASF